MKTQKTNVFTTPWLFLLIYLVISASVASSNAQIIQNPFSLPNQPVLRSREQKEMLPETVAHHTELVSKILKAVGQDDRAAFVFRGTSAFQPVARAAGICRAAYEVVTNRNEPLR